MKQLRQKRTKDSMCLLIKNKNKTGPHGHTPVFFCHCFYTACSAFTKASCHLYVQKSYSSLFVCLHLFSWHWQSVLLHIFHATIDKKYLKALLSKRSALYWGIENTHYMHHSVHTRVCLTDIAHTRTQMQACMQACMHAWTHARAYTHTHTHIYIYLTQFVSTIEVLWAENNKPVKIHLRQASITDIILMRIKSGRTVQK